MRALAFVGVALVSGCFSSLEDFEQTPNTDLVTQTAPVLDCANYTYNGVAYDCSTLDRCDASQESIPQRVACCDCDPVLCDPPAPGECPPPDEPVDPLPTDTAESCMECHNGSNLNDYAGTGMSNPHPFGSGTQYLKCTQCHGGNGAGLGKDDSHVPRPPELGNDDYDLIVNPESYFNYLTRTGIDKYPDYTDARGNTWTALEYLQFMNPGDTRATSAGLGCGTSGCHGGEHTDWFARGPINTELGFYSNTSYTIGAPNYFADREDWYSNTASDFAFRAVSNPAFVYDSNVIGPIPSVAEIPTVSVYGDVSGMYNNPTYDANAIQNTNRYNANIGDQYVNQVIPGSPLVDVVYETVVFQCGDCHAGSAGANNRYGDFRSSGCTICHMNYSLDGTSKSTDPNVEKDEPANPDAIAAPERPHVESHQIRNVAKFFQTSTGPTFISGIKDNACVGCHQGSNRTVLQYWGIRLDQNADLANGFQYPANPVTFSNTAADVRLFDPAVQNATFNGRNADQYILLEDYNGNQLDDTPPDIHYERGMACIDCHGSPDTHNGTISDDGTGNMVPSPDNGVIWSKMEQNVGVECESCHGDMEDYAYTTGCVNYDGIPSECVADRRGNPLRNVTKDAQGNYWLTSRLDSVKHFVPQTLDTAVDNGKVHPLTGQRVYSVNASYSMGVANGTTLDGVGPKQTNPLLYSDGFTHMDDLSCDACHASWNNNCIGCHLQLTYNANANAYFFSNTTGERITVQVTNADFTYINPFWYFLEVTPHGTIGSGQPGMKAFYRYQDLNGNLAQGITFSDRNGMGSNPNSAFGTSATPAMSHNRIYAHSIRGRQDAYNEGPKQCVVCHLNQAMVDDAAAWAAYEAYYADMVNQNYANLDFALLQQVIGQNTQNNLNSPYYVHMVAGLGTGLLLMDANGCPVNPLDANANRQFCQGVAPADNFDVNNAAYNLDRVVEITGAVNASFTKPIMDPLSALDLRGGSINPQLSGPMGTELLHKLADPATTLILDSWLDSAGAPQGDAANYLVGGY